MNKSRRYLRILLALATVLALLCPMALAEADAIEAPVAETEFELGEVSEALDAAEEEVIEAEVLEAEDAPSLDEDFELDEHEINVGVGEKYELYPAAGGAMPTFTSSNKKIATVAKDGTVKGVKVGTCTITAVRGDEVDYCDVTVMKAPKTVTLNYKTISLGYDASQQLGESFDLEYDIAPEDCWTNTVKLSGYNAKIVQIDDDNEVTAVGVGSTKIKVSTYNSKSATVKITVTAAPSDIAFNKDYLSLGAGSSYELKVVVPAKTTANPVFESSDEDVAYVTPSGVVHAVAPGSCTISAECFNGAYCECDVDVVPAPTWIEAEPEDLLLGAGETAQLTVTSDVEEISGGLTFSTSKKSYATVTADGLVKGVKKGNAIITVRTYNGCTADVPVVVMKAPSKITLDKKTLTLGMGEEEQLIATLPKDTYGKYTWETSDDTVADVDEEGYVYGVGTGTAKITVRTFNKKTATCTVSVIAGPAEIDIPDEVTVPYKKTAALPVSVIDESDRAYQGVVKTTFEPTGIASWSNGKVKGLAEGVTVMTVTAGELSESCLITVERIPSSVQAIAHRGGIGGTGIEENTLEAFWYADEIGADGVELDVHSTKDGVQVVNHDTTFYVGSKKYTIKSTKFSDIRKKKPSIPTLDEALEVIAQTDLKLHLELKTSADGKKCVEAVRRYGLEDRTIYFGFYETPLKAVYKADPDAILGLSLESGTNPTSSSTLKKAEKLHIKILVTNKAQITEARVEQLHDLEYEISAWTPDSVSDIEKCIDADVDYILSNYPERVMDLR
ncbi:MAG: Ig-like domain-containing protein [Clostridia bacterium]|nr:Ig-like domain-containing protein [Clostridia bacterium]